MLDEVLLKRLKTIHECGSFARAAEQLFVSRQALVEQVFPKQSRYVPYSGRQNIFGKLASNRQLVSAAAA